MFHVPERSFDECGGTMQARQQVDALLFKDRVQLFESRFQRPGDFHGVGAVLAGHRHQDAPAALDDGVSKFRLRAFDDAGDVLEPHAEAVGMSDDYFA